MPLYTLAVVDQHGCGRPVIQALMYREDQAHIATFLLASKKLAQDSDINIDLGNSIFLVDKDMAEIGALHTVFPGQTVLLCRFHVMRALTDEMKKQSLTAADKEHLLGVRFPILLQSG